MNPVLFSAAFSLLIYSELQRPVECSTSDERESIVRELLTRGHNWRVRPDGQAGGGSPVVVTMSFSLLRILEVDEVHGMLKMMGYLQMDWTDPRLAFSDRNISSVRLDASDIWTPDIELWQPDSDGLQILNLKNRVVVSSTGSSVWIPIVTLGSFCDKNLGYFHSAMNCTLLFGSWTYSGDDVDLQLLIPNVDTTDYVPQGRWTLESASAARLVKRYSCCPQPFYSVEYTFHVVSD